jgi:hypothetical protein
MAGSMEVAMESLLQHIVPGGAVTAEGIASAQLATSVRSIRGRLAAAPAGESWRVALEIVDVERVSSCYMDVMENFAQYKVHQPWSAIRIERVQSDEEHQCNPILPLRPTPCCGPPTHHCVQTCGARCAPVMRLCQSQQKNYFNATAAIAPASDTSPVPLIP